MSSASMSHPVLSLYSLQQDAASMDALLRNKAEQSTVEAVNVIHNGVECSWLMQPVSMI